MIDAPPSGHGSGDGDGVPRMGRLEKRGKIVLKADCVYEQLETSLTKPALAPHCVPGHVEAK